MLDCIRDVLKPLSVLLGADEAALGLLLSILSGESTSVLKNLIWELT